MQDHAFGEMIIGIHQQVTPRVRGLADREIRGGIVITRRIAAAAAVVLALGLAACGSADHTTMGSGVTPSHSASTQNTVGNAADAAFLTAMIPHHQQALHMADMALTQSDDQKVKELAATIKNEQDPEITQMQQWLDSGDFPSAGASNSSGMGGMDAMDGMADGMMSNEDMDTLMGLQGMDFDAMWLTMMIAHHEGAITMSKKVLATTSDERIRTLANNIITGQTAEITTMKSMLHS